MTSTRRAFLKLASAGVCATGLRMPGRAGVWSALDAYPHAGDPSLRELAATALDAAKAAGASYADIRLTLTRTESGWISKIPTWQMDEDSERAAVGVRVLADGAWGFAAGTLWTGDHVAFLAREAAGQARANARDGSRQVDLGPPPPVASGTWTTPIERDPFTVPFAEKLAVMQAIMDDAARIDFSPYGSTSASWTIGHRRQEKTFASTDGAFCTQTLYWSMPSLRVKAGSASRTVDTVRPRAGGWEWMLDPAISRDIPRYMDEAKQMTRAEPVDPNRYDIVCDATAVALLLARTIGVAGELDRVLGYEANAGGTSYFPLPDAASDRSALGSTLLNISANRSEPGAVATVKWDDEGVEPEGYPVVKDGVLVDYHTNREVASLLAPRYQRAGRPVRSHGCATSESALHVPLVQAPNLVLHPGMADTTLDDLVAGLDDGLVIVAGSWPFRKAFGPVTVDRQQLNGEINGDMMYRVKGGKRVGFVRDAECLFRAPELWKSLAAIGGPRSQQWTGCPVEKGQPMQRLWVGAGAVPARFQKIAVTQRQRKA